MESGRLAGGSVIVGRRDKRRVRVVLIAGPTASGKSRLASQIATNTGGTVVNADSMQVYRELNVITARPTTDEQAASPHRLYGHVPAETRYSVGEWLREMALVLAEAEGLLVVVGGTGLYFKALTEGLAEVPPIPREIRAAVRDRAKRAGAADLHERLAEIDPEGAASIRPSDLTRIVRALEVIEATGRPLGEWQRSAAASPVLATLPAARLVLSPDPIVLHERISARAEAMAAAGALAETETLLAKGLDPELPVMKAIGVRELAGHLRGDTSLDEAVAAIKTETRRYAKRQMTWFRGQMRDWRWLSDAALLDVTALAP
jgi:tRNA dimethylallyltransferase